jgi:hypothetical protein
MVVAVRNDKLLASLVTFALVVGPAGVGSVAGVTETTTPDCRAADDGTRAYLCQIPDECQEDVEGDECPVPSECEQVDQNLYRCEPPEDAETSSASEDTDDGPELIRSSGEPERAESPPMTECRLDTDSDELVCKPTEECRRMDECEPPPECRKTGEHRFRCQPHRGQGPPDHAAEAHNSQAQRPSENGSGSDQECRPGDERSVMICQPPEECEGQVGETRECTPPPDCEVRDDGLIRCPVPGDGAASKASASAGGHAGAMAECEPGEDRGVVTCQPPEECEGQVGETEACTPPPECEPLDDGTLRCEVPEDARHSSAGPAPSCEPGEERGAMICQPPEECEGQVGETEACTPPPECEPLGDGTFRCEVPDRIEAERGVGEAQAGEADTEMGEEDPFQEKDPQARAEAKSAIADAIHDTAESFREELASMKSDYRDRVDELRSEYADEKAQLRADYEDCRDAIPDDASPQERNTELRACVDEARQGLADLRERMEARHDEVKQSFQQRADQARADACQQAENAALQAVADRGLFDANPGDLMPERALELCPSFADFDRGGGGQ